MDVRWRADGSGPGHHPDGVSGPAPTSRITVASAGRISSLDPAQASTLGATQLISALGDPLYRLKRDGSLEPRLAASAPF